VILRQGKKNENTVEVGRAELKLGDEKDNCIPARCSRALGAFQEATRNEMELMNLLVLLAAGARFENPKASEP
jgi:hypothetical protein